MRREKIPPRREMEQDRTQGGWFKITIPVGIKYDKTWLLNLIQNECSVPFTPVDFHYENMQAQFFVANASAASALKNSNFKIWDQQNEKISIFVIPSAIPDSVQKKLKSEKKEQLKQTMNKQHDVSQKALECQRLHSDPDLMTHDMEIAMNPRKDMAASLQVHEENMPKLLTLNSSNNKPQKPESLSDTMQRAHNIKNMNFSTSEVRSRRQIMFEGRVLGLSRLMARGSCALIFLPSCCLLTWPHWGWSLFPTSPHPAFSSKHSHECARGGGAPPSMRGPGVFILEPDPGALDGEVSSGPWAPAEKGLPASVLRWGFPPLACDGPSFPGFKGVPHLSQAEMGAIRDCFPKLLHLDGKELPSPILIDTEVPEIIQPCKESYKGSETLKSLVLQFLLQYYLIYDYGDRQGLLGVYHKEACFSLTTPFMSQDTAPSSLSEYLEVSRNLKLKDSDLRVRLLKHTKHDIVASLSVLPKTQHDLGSFVVDMCIQTKTMLCFSVNGVFKEVEGKSQGSVRAFTQTFILTSGSNSGLCIMNNEMIVRNASTKETQRAFSITVPTPSSSCLPTLSQEQQEMVQALSIQSGKNHEYSQKCLQDNKWNYTTAGQVFTMLKAEGKIPEEAFTQSP
ncbi:nuclear RNA export factor 1-like [Choloepus didactylus]|uniref:nuclear RNA export factor 1-like n=1 Tax=Choloepus didactylus TaxID=27675 RepID=UPI00189EB30F|nr:nuclear RNA export factor 1-like [Choloepus didactylus]